MKKFTKRIVNAKPGFRFRRGFIHMRRQYGSHWTLRFGLLVLGAILILAGVVMLVTPGPGWLFILAGVIMVTCVSYGFARKMDKAEKHIRTKYQMIRKRNKHNKHKRKP